MSAQAVVKPKEHEPLAFDWLTGTKWRVYAFNGQNVVDKTKFRTYDFFSEGKVRCEDENPFNGPWVQESENRIYIDNGSCFEELNFVKLPDTNPNTLKKSRGYFISVELNYRDFMNVGIQKL